MQFTLKTEQSAKVIFSIGDLMFSSRHLNTRVLTTLEFFKMTAISIEHLSESYVYTQGVVKQIQKQNKKKNKSRIDQRLLIINANKQM